MNKEEIIKRALYILHTTGYTNQLDKSICIDAIENLQQENKQLKEENEILKRDIEAMKHNYNLLVRCIENGESMTQKFENGLNYQDYKTRIDKAIDYIENHKYKYWNGFGEMGIEDREFEKETNPEELLEILKGDSNE